MKSENQFRNSLRLTLRTFLPCAPTNPGARTNASAGIKKKIFFIGRPYTLLANNSLAALITLCIDGRNGRSSQNGRN